MFWSVALLLALAQLGVATPLTRRWDDVAVKHSWVELPRGWEYHSSAPADYKFDMRVALKQDKIDALIANLWETSDPGHPRYGQHLTPAEAEALVAPHPDSREAVDAWLQHHGITPENIAYSTGGGEWVTIRVSVAEAERMLDTKYDVYHHPSSSERVVRALSYSLPRELHSHVDVITPTTYFGTMRSMRATSFLVPLKEEALEEDFSINAAVPSSCASAITISCLRTLYNTSSYVPAATSVNKLGVSGYLEEYANRADLQTFFKTYRTDAVGSSYTTVLINGGLDNQNVPGVEVPQDYAVKVCNLFAQLGSIGTTAFFSSGDEGVGGGNCLTNDGTSKTLFQPAFPASCPYVTAVGGTTKVSPEVAVSFSGGGFSRYFAQPSYQTSAVSTFLTSLGSTYSGLYNATGRAYPDVSAQGSAFRVIVSGAVNSVSGTSASSPTVAGIFSLLNDVRLAAGKPSLGFVNPLIYSNPSSFNDIVSGSNPGCSTNGSFL
ncbi:hypothetical protein C0991_010881 [Blastosporella zonata]|nr:hypothetical protein C0991_010881 [Blastosporella zonata]